MSMLKRMFWSAGCLLLLAQGAQAAGMVPETSVLIVNEADGEASISVRNDDPTPALLLVTLQNLPEDEAPLLFLTQPAWRVEAGQEQRVRFMLRATEPLQTQRLKRVIFEGVPQQAVPAAGVARVGVSVRQNLPVIIHPKGLAPNRSPWEGLQWRQEASGIKVENPTPYVVRLAQEVRLMPGDEPAYLPRTYVLPGESLALRQAPSTRDHQRVRLFPATVYGFAVDEFETPLLGGRN
ncbi:fimbria/pilus periplasmic chaperone [Pantoea sp. Tr-811]|uniref:fimbria/pilus chaperone family protein n=1 Tax=unclassified Pantoea TaxID=2630326 RepID=UPI0014226818|nr:MULTISPECIES: fimbria/pilus chaperone family protein [unclassified Pantoea]NIE78155.1 fimbria/pilus periplasmic chaperone [Pantoea sp. Ap-967]NIF29694.1 fimbria/pilus periplasmic chaperone [Pantoea sp. Tr-811]